MEGFMYPNEVELQWSVLIVLYPFLTGLVAGAFILASLERVFRVEAVKPTYRLSLLTALAFLLVAPLPLQLHLGHPERSLEMYLTPHRASAMAMFGFVYLWYLMAVLLVEIWLDYRRDIVLMAQSSRGVKGLFYRVLTLGSDNISPNALRIDDRVGWIITLIGIPSTRPPRKSAAWISWCTRGCFCRRSCYRFFVGTVAPLALLAVTQLVKLSELARKRIYALAATLTMIGIFAMRWNVVIGGQLFSKSFLGYTSYKIGFVAREGLLPAIVLMILPLIILYVLIKVLPPWGEAATSLPQADAAD
jgi:predicted membrane protein